jgi:tetrahydromethanopterin S-methyltransferase subunit D
MTASAARMVSPTGAATLRVHFTGGAGLTGLSGTRVTPIHEQPAVVKATQEADAIATIDGTMLLMGTLPG